MSSSKRIPLIIMVPMLALCISMVAVVIYIAAIWTGSETPSLTTTEATTNTIAVYNIFHTQVTYPTGFSSRPLSVTTADVNGDNKPDIIVANNYGFNVGVLLNSGTGIFSTQVTYPTGLNSKPRSVAIADVNGDKKSDIIVANKGGSNVGVLLNSGTGTFSPQVTYSTGSNSYPKAVTTADINGDNKPDIIVANYNDHNVGIFLNSDNGIFNTQVIYSTGTKSYPQSVVTADVNGDKKPDIIVANKGGSNVGVLLNSGIGTFNPLVTYYTGNNSDATSVAIADINGDSKPDIIVANYNDHNVGVLLNSGNGTFDAQVAYPSGHSPYSVATTDINGDNKIDIIVANYNGHSIGVLHNSGNGTFKTQVVYYTSPSFTSSPTSVATADVNGDSKPDIIVANSGKENVGIFFNC